MNIIVLIAALGLILNILGRVLLIREDTALAIPARWLVATVPGADIVYMIFRWEKARIGTLVCAFSFALFLPLVGQLMTNLKSTAAMGQPATLSWAVLTMAAPKGVHEPEHLTRERNEQLVAAKRKKLGELHAYLQKWYLMLKERKGYLCDELPEEIRAFNHDAAAYHGLLAVEKTELVELQELETRAH